MSDEAAIEAAERQRRRVRYLKIIGVFKILQGLLLLSIGLSLLFLHSRTGWLDDLSDWVDGELMVAHSQAMLYFLSRLQDVVAAGGLLQVTGFVALFYAIVLCTEGVGVYLQQHWAEVLMVIATATLIPFEIRHAIYHPGAVVITIVVLNCLIVWFLYRVLQREWREKQKRLPAKENEVLEVR
jgi:uncharacterized membrane protein (DUF2068 family)